MSAPSFAPTVIRRIRITEWEYYPPEQGSVMEGIFLSEDSHTRQVVEHLSNAGILHIEELRHGLRIRATSWVGRITLDNIEITIEPKILGLRLLTLVRYAYGLRNLDLHGVSSFDLSEMSFLDLLIHQLVAEVDELTRRGLRREYIRDDADLTLPRGRIDIRRYARDLGRVSTTLPCSFHPRTIDTTLNQTLYWGLRHGSKFTSDPTLRATLMNRCLLFEEDISSGRLNRRSLQMARQNITRLTAAYTPALRLIELLMGDEGVNLEEETDSLNVPGFLFDMNRFFQALLSRFLSDNLPEFIVMDEQILRGMMTYDPLHNPQHKLMPAPRPDFVVMQGSKMVAVLDAKYRDLWEKPLPREMLYQLATYALSQQERRIATILYPTLNSSASEVHIMLKDMVHGSHAGRVILRPVNMNNLADLIDGDRNEEERRCHAKSLAFGSEG